MKTESQVCTLEQAKKLKELGVKQESNFYWVRFNYNNGANDWWLLPLCLWTHFISLNRDKIIFPDNASYWWDKEFKPDEVYSAFTCAEFSNMMPENIYVKDKKDDYWLEIHKEDELIYSAAYRSLDGHCIKFANDSEMTHSVASLLTQVIESGLITVEEINAKS